MKLKLKRTTRSQMILLAAAMCGVCYLIVAVAAHPERVSAADKKGELSNSGKKAGMSGLIPSLSKAQLSKAQIAQAKSEKKGLEPRPIAEAWKQSTARLKYLDRCVKSQNCEGFSQESPDDYYLETRLAQAAEILEFKKIATEWQTAFGVTQLPKEAFDIAKHFLRTGDDYVKDAALELVADTQPTLQERDALLKALSDSGSGPLYEKAMRGALLKYKGDPLVDRLLLYQAARGATKVQSVIAMQSLPYLTGENQGLFEIVASKKNQRSMEAAYWRANFAEKERMNEGG